MFWGLFFIAVGVIFLINYTFGIHLPVFRILFSLAIIYFGFSLLFGSFGIRIFSEKRSTDKEAIFSKSDFSYTANQAGHFQTVFGEGKLDLTKEEKLIGSIMRVSTVFGNTHITVKKNTPLWIEAATVFGSTKLPGENVSAFGEFTYKTPGISSKSEALYIKTEAVFGKILVEEE